MSDQDLAYHLQIKFGLSYNEPNSYQILAIKSDINQIVRSGRTPTQADWIRMDFTAELLGHILDLELIIQI